MPRASSAFRFTAGDAGFLNLSRVQKMKFATGDIGHTQGSRESDMLLEHETNGWKTILKLLSGFERDRQITLPTLGEANQRGSGTVVNLTAPRAILTQLGGEGFVVMTGANGFVGSADSLTFKLGNNPKRVTHVRITLTPEGLYDMTFFMTGKGPRSHDGVHREMLQEVFGANTGLYRSQRASA